MGIGGSSCSLLASLALLVVGLPRLGLGAETSAVVAPTQIGPGVSVDIGKREVYLDATVCLRRGILEYMICAKRTFEHEAIFATEGKASHLHTSLLLIGAEPFAYSITDDWPAQVRANANTLLVISVDYEDQGMRQRRPISDFARNRERADGVVGNHWAFAGSVFYTYEGKERYAADSAGGIIGLTAKGASVVQFAERLGIPYQGDSLGLECRDDLIPPLGTAVRVIFSVATPPTTTAPTPAVDGNPAPTEKH
jgi:hypothetical protein